MNEAPNGLRRHAVLVLKAPKRFRNREVGIGPGRGDLEDLRPLTGHADHIGEGAANVDTKADGALSHPLTFSEP